MNHRLALLVFPMLLFTADRALAGASDSPVIALHASRTVAKGDLCSIPVAEQIPCRDFTVDEVTHYGLRVYLVAAGVDSATGIRGLSCGLSVDDPLYVSWRLCADEELQHGSWPLDGSGNRIGWTNCNRGVVFPEDGVKAVAGYMYVYAYGDGALGVTANNASGDSQRVVVDCGDSDLIVDRPGGRVGFGAESGFNPCLDATGTERATWGGLKTRFGGEEQ